MGVTDRDKGYKKMMRAFFDMNDASIEVGVLQDTESGMHQDGVLTIGDLAEIHEFGLGNVPMRSFIRGWVDENTTEIRQMLTRVVIAVATKGQKPERAMGAFGEWVKGGMQERISNGIQPALLPATIRRKDGKEVPLINSGQLRASITYQISWSPKQ